MPVTIEYGRTFLKALSKLPPKIEDKFYLRLVLFLQNPIHPMLNNHAVEAAYPGCRSINVTGDYRAIYKQTDDVVSFLYIGTHAQLYG